MDFLEKVEISWLFYDFKRFTNILFLMRQSETVFYLSMPDV